MAGNKATVFVLNRDETGDGRFHEVAWATDGDLNKTARRVAQGRPNIRSHGRRQFRLRKTARAFATQKGKDLGIKPTFSRRFAASK